MSGTSFTTKICLWAGKNAQLFLPLIAAAAVLLLLVTLIDCLIKRSRDRYGNYWLLIPHAAIPAAIALATVARLGLKRLVEAAQPLTTPPYAFFAVLFGAMLLWLVGIFLGAYAKKFPISLVLVLVADVALAIALLLGTTVEFLDFTQVMAL